MILHEVRPQKLRCDVEKALPLQPRVGKLVSIVLALY